MALSTLFAHDCALAVVAAPFRTTKNRGVRQKRVAGRRLTIYNTDSALTADTMTPNPALGVLFHWLGGLASGSFYVPFRGVKKWSWETYWLVGGFFSWIIA